MNTEKLKSTVRSIKRNTYTAIRIARPLKTRKAFNHLNVVKVSLVSMKVGGDYEKQKAVIEKRANGELPSENQGLPWGEWLEFPYFITHKGILYVRFAIDEGSYKAKVRYYCNGKRISKDVAKEYCLAGEFNSSKPDCITVKAENLSKVKSGSNVYIT